MTKGRTLLSAELGVKQVAYVDEYRGNFEGVNRRLRVRNLSTGRDQVVYRANSGGLNAAQITKPAFTGDLASFVWARTNLGSGSGNRVVRYTLRTGTLSYAQGNPRYASTSCVNTGLGAVASTSIDATTDVEGKCRDAGVEYCRIEYTGPLSFTLAP